MESSSTEFLLRPSTGFLLFPHGNIPAMGERHTRLIKAREAAGFRTATAAAQRFHWKTSTYLSHENGQTPLPARVAERYAKAFKVSPGWLLTEEGTMKPGAQNRIESLIKAIPPENIDIAISYLEFLARHPKGPR